MCPVCKSGVSIESIIPVYIRDGKVAPVAAAATAAYRGDAYINV